MGLPEGSPLNLWTVATVLIAYWAPLYLTVDVERGEVVSARIVSKGMRSGGRLSGQFPNGREGDAARIVADVVAKGELHDIEVT